ncbi:MAG: DUF1036 domain-containing protein [Flavipsychrobacter sp.]|nr:DUF1036 domain-containing protein [Flavipsychrobacter sp.]
MKRILAIVSSVFIMQQSYSQTFMRCNLVLRNNTSDDLSVSYMYQEKDLSWTSVGWYKIPKYNQASIPVMNYSNSEGIVYVHGTSTKLVARRRSWGSRYEFCIDKQNAFRIYHANKVSCKSKAGFDAVSLKNNHDIVYDFNP